MPNNIVVEISSPPPILVEVNGLPPIEVFLSPGGVGGKLGMVERIAVTTVGQTSFTLSAIAVAPHLSQLYLNGEKATYPDQYIISSTQLTWLGVELDPEDTLELYS